MNAPTLFDPVPVARAGDPITSHHAADVARRNAPEQRRRILLLLAATGRDGATADELDMWGHWPISTAGKRMGELVASGHVRVALEADGVTPVTRPTRRGAKGRVYVLARLAGAR